MKPGYLPRVVNCETGILINVDLVHMIVRPETAYDVYQHVSLRSKNADTVFKNCVVGHYVVTSYNNRVYCVKDVEFPFSPATVFAFKDGVHTFKEYFEQVSVKSF